MALGLDSPWYVEEVKLLDKPESSSKEIHLYLNFTRGHKFVLPDGRSGKCKKRNDYLLLKKSTMLNIPNLLQNYKPRRIFICRRIQDNDISTICKIFDRNFKIVISLLSCVGGEFLYCF